MLQDGPLGPPPAAQPLWAEDELTQRPAHPCVLDGDPQEGRPGLAQKGGEELNPCSKFTQLTVDKERGESGKAGDQGVGGQTGEAEP